MESETLSLNKSELNNYIKSRVKKELQEIQEVDEIEQQEIDELYKDSLYSDEDVEYVEL